MASTPTDAVPAPLPAEALGDVPGVLGAIARERAADYAAVPVPEPGRRGTPDRLRWALAGPDLAVIAEIKRSSPSQGAIRELDPVATAGAYARGGAAALSVLTEPRHFGGELAHLRSVSAASPVPTLRKEFVVHPAQVTEAAESGAAAVLLIAALLGEALGPYLRFARAVGLDALVEVHDEAELARAREVGADVLGVNNRDLTTLEVDTAVAPRLLALAREDGFTGVGVAESGYADAEAVASLRGVADAVLIGTSLAGRDDPAAALRTLLGEA